MNQGPVPVRARLQQTDLETRAALRRSGSLTACRPTTTTRRIGKTGAHRTVLSDHRSAKLVAREKSIYIADKGIAGGPFEY